jgi:hypothetical protein
MLLFNPYMTSLTNVWFTVRACGEVVLGGRTNC